METAPSTIDKWPIVACPQRVWINQKEENPSIIDLVRMGLPSCHGCRQPTMGTKDPIQLYNCFCLANQNSVSRWQGAASFPPSLYTVAFSPRDASLASYQMREAQRKMMKIICAIVFVCDSPPLRMTWMTGRHNLFIWLNNTWEPCAGQLKRH